MITIKSKKQDFGISFPVSLEEITKDKLEAITKNIKLPKYHAIVALCIKTNIFEFVVAAVGNKQDLNTNVQVSTLLAKVNDVDNTLNAEVGDKVIMPKSSIERGVHINIPCMLSTRNVAAYFANDRDLYKSIIKQDEVIIDNTLNKQLRAANSPSIYVMEFKIVPITDINAAIPVDSDNDIVDPFVVEGNG